MRFLHEDEGYDVAVDQVARAVGVPRAQVEKDYFITHVLWALHVSGLQVWFKGGTCLSKGFGIISRFSEDLDLKIESGTAPGVAPDPNWRGEKDSHAAGRRDWFGRLASSVPFPGCTAAINQGFVDERHRSTVIDVSYPGSFVTELGPAIRPWVRLEVGSARVTPFLSRPITSWLHEHAIALGAMDGLVDNRPPPVRCVHPLVTLIEKLDAMTRRWERADLDPVVFVRHWEDAASVIDALPALPASPMSAGDLVAEMLATRQIRARPTSNHPAFTLQPGPRADALVSGHAAISGMYFGNRPRRTIPEANLVIRRWIDEHVSP